MYRFQVRANTQIGEFIGLVGSTPELGMWDVNQCIRLRTSGENYPLWWAETPLKFPPGADSPFTVQYKYVRLNPEGIAEWEAWGTNRWVPVEADPPPATITVEDGWLGFVPAFPYGYFQEPVPEAPPIKGENGLKIAVVGSSVALGCNAWLLRGWAWHLQKALHEKYGHALVNLSQLGANVSSTINRFPLAVAPEQPDIVIIALSLGNEGFAYCPPHQRRAIQRRFERGLQQLVKMTKELGAIPILGGVYPHGDYYPEHQELLRETHHRMFGWGVSVLNWLDAVDDGEGRWKEGISSSDAAHPNTLGQRFMYDAIDLSLFDIDQDTLIQHKERSTQKQEIPIYSDNWGFHVFASPEEKSLRVINTSKHTYTIAGYWEELQTALQKKAELIPGIYISKTVEKTALPYFWSGDDCRIETLVNIPPNADIEYAAFNFFAPKESEVLYYDGLLGLLKESDSTLRVINESDHEYNIHPMWKEIRSVLKAMPPGVYEDLIQPDAPFRTMMIGKDGLESRVKVPGKSSVIFEYKCPLSDVSRVAIIPLGDRCAARMLLYKMEYDGPAFPFDLTRTTNLGDIADMIETGFSDMWNPQFLHYNHDHGRIYHTKWSGLSFAHEVEETDDPLNDMSPVHERMRVRYSARSQRFWYAIKNCDEALFVRTGITHRGYVLDLVDKLTAKCHGKPFRLLLISPQYSGEFSNIPNVLHYNLEFNPDKMYEDLDYWMHCTTVMREILESLGVSSKNLYWCPPNPPKDQLLKSS